MVDQPTAILCGVSFFFIPLLYKVHVYAWDGGLIIKLCLTLVTPWVVAHQAPLSMGFPRQEYWSGLLFPSVGDLLDPGSEPRSPTLQAGSLPIEQPGKPTFMHIHQ